MTLSMQSSMQSSLKIDLTQYKTLVLDLCFRPRSSMKAKIVYYIAHYFIILIFHHLYDT
uniref:Uncharacterized protein n=1 Tax=Spodoptera exigua multiple nucleopolyhedrovirus TaxID=10454 RepID=A0A6N0C2E9_9ABAC|nr:hypothetical protein [Spodoptera exigua multiple nucleopolyhedrovirus]